MANTQVFPLGLSVTVVNPLGLAIAHLHRDVERLRRQADGTRLGRLIGEVIRLGSELGKVRQAERQLALDQEQQQEDQIARLGDEVEAVERLRQHYLMLDRVIAGLARLKPFRASLLTSMFRSSLSVTREAKSTSPGQLSAAAAPAKVASPEFKVLARGALVAAGLGMTALVSRRGARAVMRRHPRNTQQRVARVAGQAWQEHRVDAIGKVGKALVEGESGEEKAQGVGAAVGEVGGRVLGAVLARLTTSRLARKHGADAGAYLGDAFGKLVGGKLYDWVTQDAKAEPSASVTPGPAGERAASGLLEPKAQAQPQSQEAPAVLKQGDEAATPGSIGQGAETGAPGAWSLLPLLKKGTGFGLPGIGTLFNKVPGAALLDASLQMVETYNSNDAPAQKLEGYVSAAGGLGGTLAGAAAGAALGSVVPVIGTAIGGLIGGVLGGMGGESAGGWLGRTVASITGNDEPGSSSEPATPLNVPQARAVLPSLQPSTPEQSWQSAPPSTINQQFTFTANMPVTFNNSFDDPTTLQQLETIARRVLDDLMRQARSVQMADQPQP